MSEVANRYSGTGLFMPKRTHDTISQFTGAQKTFPRLVDAWWVGLCIGVKLNKSQNVPGNRTKFMDGNILSSDPWRITHLELIALADEGEQVLKQPSRVVAIATGYANFGLNWLVDNCLLDSIEPQMALLNRLSLESPAT